MKALEFPILADENVHPDVIAFLRRMGVDVKSAAERGKYGLPDAEVLRQANETARVILTHETDFGGLALMGAQFLGIIYIRPGDIRPDFAIKSLQVIRDKSPHMTPRFILTAQRADGKVKIRVRQM